MLPGNGKRRQRESVTRHGHDRLERVLQAMRRPTLFREVASAQDCPPDQKAACATVGRHDLMRHSLVAPDKSAATLDQSPKEVHVLTTAAEFWPKRRIEIAHAVFRDEDIARPRFRPHHDVAGWTPGSI